jgi:osmotically-inducible protein OsmY
MKSNEKLQQDVENAIKWEPLLHAAEIGVTVEDGTVTLFGTVDNYMKKLEAEHAAKNVKGVRAIVEKIEVALPYATTGFDQEIAANVVKALDDSWSVPNKRIRVKVENGWVYLDGDLSWNYQREAAISTASKITGVKGVINNINIKSDIHNQMEEKLIRDALKRNSLISADDIRVEVSGTTVSLYGMVSSIYQKEEAGRIAWKTPGIWNVVNNLVVEYDYAAAEQTART